MHSKSSITSKQILFHFFTGFLKLKIDVLFCLSFTAYEIFTVKNNVYISTWNSKWKFSYFYVDFYVKFHAEFHVNHLGMNPEGETGFFNKINPYHLGMNPEDETGFFNKIIPLYTWSVLHFIRLEDYLPLKILNRDWKNRDYQHIVTISVKLRVFNFKVWVFLNFSKPGPHKIILYI